MFYISIKDRNCGVDIKVEGQNVSVSFIYGNPHSLYVETEESLEGFSFEGDAETGTVYYHDEELFSFEKNRIYEEEDDCEEEEDEDCEEEDEDCEEEEDEDCEEEHND